MLLAVPGIEVNAVTTQGDTALFWAKSGGSDIEAAIKNAGGTGGNSGK